MAAVNFSPIFNGWQGFTPSGLPLTGGFVQTYLAGSSTPAATYTTNAGNIANSTPIQLGADGRPPAEIWLTAGIAYKFVLTDSLSNSIATYDNVIGIVNASSAIWVPSGVTPTFFSATQFTVPGNLTTTFQVGIRIQYTITATQFYGSVTAAVFALGVTTVTVLVDSTPLSSGLNAVNVSQLTPDNSPIPVVIEQATTFQKLDTHTLGINVGNSAQTGLATLDWYEEGSFTPTIRGSTSAGTATYSTQQADFQRIGNTVNYQISLGWSVATGTGSMLIAGFPYAQNALEVFGTVAYFGTASWGTGPFGLFNNPAFLGGTTMVVTDGAGNILPVKAIGTFVIQGFYRI